MRSLLYFLFFAIGTSTISAQYFPVKRENRWGMIDQKGEIIIDLRYRFATYLGTQGIPYFHLEDSIGTIVYAPSKGAILKHPKKNLVFRWLEPTIRNEVNTTSFLLLEGYNEEDKTVYNLKGEKLFQGHYREIKCLKENHFAVRQGYKWGIVDQQNRMLLPIEYPLFKIDEGGYVIAGNNLECSLLNPQLQNVPGPANSIFHFLDKAYVMYSNNSISPQQLLTLNQTQWGLMDKRGNVLTEPIYERFEVINDSLLKVSARNKYGFINHRGEVLFSPQFEELSALTKPVIKVRIGRKYGLINLKGEWLAKALYDHIDIGKEYARLRNGNEFSMIPFKPDGSRSFVINFQAKGQGDDERTYGWEMHRSGYWFWRDTLRNSHIKDRTINLRHLPKSGVTFYQVLRTIGEKGKKRISLWGVMDHRTGKILVKPQYEWLAWDDLKIYPSMRARTRSNRYALITRQGKILPVRIKKRIHQFGDFKRGAAQIIIQEYKHKRKYEFSAMNVRGQLLHTPGSGYISEFEEGYAIFTSKGKYGLKNVKGVQVNQTMYDQLNYGLHKVKSRGSNRIPRHSPIWKGELLITTKNQTRHTIFYEDGTIAFTGELKGFSRYQEGIIRVKALNGRWGYLDKHGKWLIEPQFRYAKDFQEGWAVVRGKNMWGYVNPKGEYLADGFQEIHPFHSGVGLVKIKGRFGYLRSDGSWLFKPKLKEAQPFQKEGFAIVRKTKFGAINQKGAWIFKPKFWEISRENDTLKARDKKGWHTHALFKSTQSTDNTPKYRYTQKQPLWVKHLEQRDPYSPAIYSIQDANEGMRIGISSAVKGLIRRNGEVVFPPIFDAITWKDGLYKVIKNGNIGYLDKEGNWVYPKEGL